MIEIRKLVKDYNSETVIKFKDEIIFEEGKSYCILGPSGSGKSTLLNIISGLIKPTEGEIYVEGRNISSLNIEDTEKFRNENIGYISQDFKLFELMSVKDNLGIVNLINKPTKTDLEVLRMVGLEGKYKAKVNTLSGGEKQRVGIARSLLNTPKIMLCDEPTGSLNTKLGKEIMELIVELHKQTNSTLIVVTHDDRMSEFFDEVISFENLIINE